MRLVKPTMLLVLSSIVATASAGLAFAQSCQVLSAELSRLQRGGPVSPEAAKYDRAVRDQSQRVKGVERLARRNGCFGGGILFFRRKPQPACKNLLPQYEAERAKLKSLQRQQAQAGGGRNAREIEIRKIRAIMRDRNCTGGGLFGRGFGPRFIWNRGGEEIYEDRSLLPSSGRYRTLCVRACDGYYFPISFSASRAQFGTDEAICYNTCPGAEAELYYHNTAGEAEQMVSLAGEPYVDIEHAFRYRETYDKECSCRINPPKPIDYEALRQENSETRIVQRAVVRLPVPMEKTGPSQDPETLMNQYGKFMPRAVNANEALTRAATGEVRIVGPEYWGAQSTPGVDLIRLPN